MRQVLFAFTIWTASLSWATNANAQIAVIDGANLGQNVQTAAQSIIAVEQLKAQLTQLEQTYEMFTNPTNILSMAAGMEEQTLENPMPSSNALSGLVEGTTPPSGAATTYYNLNHVYTPSDGSQASNLLKANAQTIANVEGIATTNLSSIEQRLQQLPTLESNLNTATSITQVSAINGRIAAESQFVQGQQAQAANLQVLAAEQVQSQQQQQQEQFDEDETDLASKLQSAAAVNEGP